MSQIVNMLDANGKLIRAKAPATALLAGTGKIRRTLLHA